uniref:Neuropeptide-like 1 n=1 Tax=Culex pipiens TaxID=7175 RepID=A0A8D8F3W0_CULPI
MGNFGMLLSPKLLLRMSTLLFLVVHNANGQYGPEGGRRLKPCELESLLRDLTYPEEGYEMHAAALRNQLRHILERDPSDGANYQSMDEYGGYENSGPYEDKRSYRSLLRDGASFGQKRNLGSLARAGLLRAPPAGDYLKRSIATLAKNGQLPSREPDSEESSSGAAAGGWTEADKRNVAAAFRSGYMLNGKRNIASLARKYELPGKRNIQSLLRTGGMMPSIAPKRNMQALARDNSLPHYGVVGGGQESKRNIQTLVRDWNLPKQQGGGGSGAAGGASGVDEKRNIQSLKSSQGGRKKRELYYDEDPLGVDESGTPEVLEPVYQSAPLDYEELMEAMSEAYPYYVPGPDGNHIEEKRFLGSRSSFTPNPSDYDNQPQAFVDDATLLAATAGQDYEAPPPSLSLAAAASAAGELPVYDPRGAQHRLESQRYTGDVFGVNRRPPPPAGPVYGGLHEDYPMPPPPPYYGYAGITTSEARSNPFYSEDEFRCAARLRKLLFYLKKQYQQDNKYIQAVYGRNPGGAGGAPRYN